MSTDVNFVVNVTGKGLDVVEKYGNEIEQVKKETDKLVQSNKKLDAENADTEKGVRKLDRAFESLRSGTERTNNAFSKMGIGITLSIAAAVATVTSKLSELTEKLKEQSTQADVLGVSFEKYQGLMALARDAGLETGQVYDQILDLSNRISEAILRTSGPAAEALAELGIEAGNYIGVDAIERTEKFTKALAGLSKEQRNFILDEMGVKDIAPVLDQLDQVDQKTKSLKGSGQIFTELEISRLKEFTTDMSNTFNDWNSILGKIAISSIPAINTVFQKTKTSTDGVTTSSKTLEKSVVIVSNVLAAMANMLQMAWGVVAGGLWAVWEIIEDVGGKALLLMKGMGQELWNGIQSMYNSTIQMLNDLIKWFQNFARKIGLDSIADGLDGFSKKLERYAKKRVEDQKKVDAELIAQREKFNKDYDALDKEGVAEVQQAGRYIGSQWRAGSKAAEQNLINIAEPGRQLEATPDEQVKLIDDEVKTILDKYQAQFSELAAYKIRELAGEADKAKKDQDDKVNKLKLELADLNARKELGASGDMTNGIGVQEWADKSQNLIDRIAAAQLDNSGVLAIQKEIEAYGDRDALQQKYMNGLEELKKNSRADLQGLISEKGVKQMEGQVNIITNQFEKTSEVVAKTVGSAAQASSVGLAAELDKLKARNAIVEEQFKMVQKIKDETAAGMYDESTGRLKAIEELKKIQTLNKSNEVIVRALVQQRALEKEELKYQEELTKKKLAAEQQIQSLRAEALKSDGKSLEAFDIEAEIRRQKVKEEFEKTGNLAEAMKLEEKIINKDRLQLQLDEVTKAIEKTQKALGQGSFFDMDETTLNQQKMLELKKQEIELNEKLGKQGKELDGIWKVTNAQMLTVFKASVNSIAEGLGRVMAGTKSLKEEAREQAAFVLGELNKIAIQYAISGFSKMFGGMAGQGTGSWVGGLLGSIASNHVGDVVQSDWTSGKGGVGSNEVVRKLKVGETVLPSSATPLLQQLLKQGRTNGIGNSGVVRAVVDSSARESILRDKQSQQTIYKMGAENGWG